VNLIRQIVQDLCVSLISHAQQGAKTIEVCIRRLSSLPRGRVVIFRRSTKMFILVLDVIRVAVKGREFAIVAIKFIADQIIRFRSIIVIGLKLFIILNNQKQSIYTHDTRRRYIHAPGVYSLLSVHVSSALFLLAKHWIRISNFPHGKQTVRWTTTLKKRLRECSFCPIYNYPPGQR
jgi:hypothetical protein